MKVQRVGKAFSVTKVNDGRNAVIADLTNQASNIACDANEKVQYDCNISTKVRIFNGAEQAHGGVTFVSAQSIALHTPQVGSFNADGDYCFRITWGFRKGDTLSAVRYDADIIVSYGGNQYKTTFSLTRLTGDASYELAPSCTEIVFTKSSDGKSLVPAQQQLYCGYKRIVGAEETVYPGNVLENLDKPMSLNYHYANSLQEIEEAYFISDFPVQTINYAGVYTLFYRTKGQNGQFSVWKQMRGAGQAYSAKFGTSQEQLVWYQMPTGILTIPSDTTWVEVELAMSTVGGAAQVSDENIIDRETIPIVKSGIDGAPWIADLDGDMDSVFADDSGNIQKAQSVSAKATLFYGIEAKGFTVGSVVRNGSTTWASDQSGQEKGHVTVTWNNSTGIITVGYAAGAVIGNGKDAFAITLKSADDATVSRICTLKVAAITGDKYELRNIRPNAISYNQTTGTPATTPLSAKVVKVPISGGDVATAMPSGYRLMFCVPNPSGNGYVVASDYVSGQPGSTTNPIATFNTTNASQSEIRVVVGKLLQAAKTIDGVSYVQGEVDEESVLDSETVPVNKATNGDPAAIASVSPGVITVPCDKNGNVKSSVSQVLTFILMVGSQVGDGLTVAVLSLPSGVTFNASTATLTVGTSATAVGIAGGATFKISGNYGGKTYSATCTVGLAGSEQGLNGETGRMYYIAGEWSHLVRYLLTASLCPVVHLKVAGVTEEWWYLKASSAYGNDDKPSDSQQSKWGMLQNYSVVLTEAIFVKDFARFGSAIISRDWLLSVHGKIDNTSYGGTVENPGQYGNLPAYTYFEPKSPDSNRRIEVSDSYFNNTTSAEKSSQFQTDAAAIIVKVYGYVSDSRGTMYLQLRREDGTVVVDNKSIASTSPTSVTLVFDAPEKDTRYSVYARMSSASYHGTITKIEQVPFVPNYAVDLLTGDSYQNTGHFRGSGEFEGTIKAKNFFHNVCYWWGVSSIYGGGEPYVKGGYEYQTSGSADVIDIMQQQGDDWMWPNVTNNNTLLLPSPSLYEGKMVTIYCRVIKCSGRINISCVETNKMVTRLTNNNGKLEPSPQAGSKVDSISLQWAYYVKASRQGSAAGEWSGTTNVDIPDVLHIPQYVFVAQDGYWFQIK